jgi:hypothetical protein
MEAEGMSNWKEQPIPEVGSRWDGLMFGIIPGILTRQGYMQKTARVMAVADGYVMARFTHAMPFVMHLSEWFQKFTPKPGIKNQPHA